MPTITHARHTPALDCRLPDLSHITGLHCRATPVGAAYIIEARDSDGRWSPRYSHRFTSPRAAQVWGCQWEMDAQIARERAYARGARAANAILRRHKIEQLTAALLSPVRRVLSLLAVMPVRFAS